MLPKWVIGALGEGLEEVGVDVGEHDGAEAFDLGDDVFVFFDALDGAFVAFVEAADDADALSGFVIGFGEDFTASGVVGCQESEQFNRCLWNWLNGVVAGLSVDPEWN